MQKNDFRGWFYEVLSAKQVNQLPIFGDVSYQEYKAKDLSFGTVQVYLIDEYLRSKDSYTSLVIQVSLALICS
jgi:hypothetical protein